MKTTVLDQIDDLIGLAIASVVSNGLALKGNVNSDRIYHNKSRRVRTMKTQSMQTDVQTEKGLITNLFVESSLSILGFLLFVLLLA